MDAIITKWLGQTNHRCSRVKATCGKDSIIMPWGWDVSIIANHQEAALILARKLGWDVKNLTWCFGGMPDKTGYAFIAESDRERAEMLT